LTLEVTQTLIICPCCGSRFEGDLREGCNACGARAVGPPLARPEHELPAYGRALFVCAAAAILFLTFLVSTVAALLESKAASIGFWNVVAAAETAAWRLKFVALPIAMLALWASVRVCTTIKHQPARFGGRSFACAGVAMSAFVVFAVVLLIGVTVPARLRQRELALKAADQALVYAHHRVLLDYQSRFGTLPTAASDLQRLPQDASVALVREMMEAGTYSPEASLASLPASTRKGRGGRRVKAVRVSATSTKNNTDDVTGEGLSFTNYTLVLAGRDKMLNTPDDIWIRDGIVVEASPSPRQTPLAPSAIKLKTTP
jgi:hypothetical protein